MRTTVTIDPDTEALLRQEIGRSGLSFKEVLNRAVRKSLASSASTDKPRITPLFSQPFPPKSEETSFNRLSDSLEDEETLTELWR